MKAVTFLLNLWYSILWEHFFILENGKWVNEYENFKGLFINSKVKILYFHILKIRIYIIWNILFYKLEISVTYVFYTLYYIL